MINAHMLENEDGMSMDLTVGSPVMLKHYNILAHDKKSYKEIEDELRQQGKWRQKEAINLAVLRTLLLSKKKGC